MISAQVDAHHNESRHVVAQAEQVLAVRYAVVDHLGLATTRARSAINSRDIPKRRRSTNLRPIISLLARAAVSVAASSSSWQDLGFCPGTSSGSPFSWGPKAPVPWSTEASKTAQKKETAKKKQRARPPPRRKKTHSYTGGSPPPPPQGQGSGRRSVADNARFGEQ